jgi:type VI secretion system protein ImpA
MAIDIESLLAEIDPESPCGEDLAYDPEYLELERAAQGTPEQQVGDTIVEAEEPNWREIRDKSIELLGRTKDLRLVMHLSLALLQMEGVQGLRDGVALLRAAIDQYWEGLYPQLDPEDDYDPLERMNILSSLSPPADVFADPMKFRERLRLAPLCRSKQLGSYCLRDLLIARGDMAPADTETSAPVEMSVIEGAFQDSDIEELQEIATAAQEAVEHMDIIDSLITQRVGVGNAPNFSELLGILKEIAACVNDFLARRGAAVGPGAEEAAAGEGLAPGAPAGAAISGEIMSPQDVIRVLDKICHYYERSEPSSPVPLLLQRAKKLVRKSFLEIIQDLTPESLRQIEIISGPQEQPDQQ